MEDAEIASEVLQRPLKGQPALLDNVPDGHVHSLVDHPRGRRFLGCHQRRATQGRRAERSEELRPTRKGQTSVRWRRRAAAISCGGPLVHGNVLR